MISWKKQGIKVEKIEIILTECIKEIKSGKATPADCLSRYASRRQELEPLLRIALNIREPAAFNLDDGYKQAAKARLLRQIKPSGQKKSRTFREIFSYGIPPRYAWARIAVSVLIGVILFSSAGGGTAIAAQTSLPGDLLYPVKTVTEDARLLVAGDSIAKTDLNLEFAQNRLEELNELVNRDEAKAGIALRGYQSNLEAARQQVLKISDIALQSGVLEEALLDIQNQTALCDEILDGNPEYSEPVHSAGNLALNEQIRLTELLAEQNNLQAVRINLNMMQNRLQRAQDKAGVNQYQLMQEALLQYQQFNRLGEQILQSSQASNNYNTEIEALTLQSLAVSLDTLDNIYQQIPQEYRDTVDVCRQVTLQFQNQARHQYQQQGPGTGSEDSPYGSGNGPGIEQGNQSNSQYQGGNVTDSQTPVITYPEGAGDTPSSEGGNSVDNGTSSSGADNSDNGTPSGGANSTDNGTSSGGANGKSPTTTGTNTPEISISPSKTY